MAISDWTWLLAGQLMGGLGIALALWGLLADRLMGGCEKRRCARCWYDLSAVQGLRCPECGKTARRERGVHRARVRRWAVLLGLVVMVPLGLASSTWPVWRTAWVRALSANQLATVWWMSPNSEMGWRAGQLIDGEQLDREQWPPRLLAIMATADGASAARAATLLRWMNVSDPAFKSALLRQMEDPGRREQALRTLGQLFGEDDEVLDLLMREARTSGQAAGWARSIMSVRSRVRAHALARLHMEGFDVSQVLDRVLQFRNASQRNEMAEAVLEALVFGLANGGAEVRVRAVLKLAQHRERLNAAAADAVTWALADESAEVWQQAEWSLRVAPPEVMALAVDGLARQLRLGQPEVRRRVMDVLWAQAREASGSLLHAMIEATADTDARVANQARLVLEQPASPVQEHLLRMALDDLRCEVAEAAAYALSRRGCADLRTFVRLCELAGDETRSAAMRGYARAAAVRWSAPTY